MELDINIKDLPIKRNFDAIRLKFKASDDNFTKIDNLISEIDSDILALEQDIQELSDSLADVEGDISDLQSDKLATEIFVGMIITSAYELSVEQRGNYRLLLCDGSLISRTTYSSLFAKIGTTWGAGDGITTFGIPDLKASHLRGVGTSTKFTDNTEVVTLAEIINDAFQGHAHLYGKQDGGASVNFGTNYTVGGPANANTTTINTYSTYGTPRVAVETRGKSTGVYFYIFY